MIKTTRRTKRTLFGNEEAWLHAFMEFHGLNGVTSFVEEDLNGVPLVRIVEALRLGKVVSADKCDGPGAECVVEYRPEYDPLIWVRVHFVSSEDRLRILEAREVEEQAGEDPHAA